MTMNDNLLLDSHLKSLRLPAFLANYKKFAADASKPYDRYLLALTEQELVVCERNRIVRHIKAARFPVAKELADFDFSAISAPAKERLLDLAQGWIHCCPRADFHGR